MLAVYLPVIFNVERTHSHKYTAHCSVWVTSIPLFLILSLYTSFFTFLSFINTSKYPPSLLYILMTLGPAVLFLAITEKATNAIAKIISVYGRVPMFYYLLHIYLIHLLAMISSELFTNVDWRTWILNQPVWFNEGLKGYGFSLVIVYLVWMAIVIGLYPLCKWYDRYKQSHKEKWWLSYL